jgi:hypothetical protein
MEVSLSTLSLNLPRGGTMRLDAARGVTVRVRCGRVWLTEQGLPDDVFLGPGQSWRLRRDGRAVIEADAASAFELAAPEARWRIARPGTRATPAQALRAALARREPGWMPQPAPSALLA